MFTGNNTTTTTEEVNEYPSGDLKAFLDDYTTEKQDMNIDETEGLDDFDAITGNAVNEEEENEPVSLQMRAGAARASGKLITTVIDTTIPAILATIAKDNVEEFKAAPEDREELEEALTEYMKLKGGDIPPSVMVIILISTIYLSKIPKVIELRKLNKKQEELNKREQQLFMLEQQLKQREQAINNQNEKQIVE